MTKGRTKGREERPLQGSVKGREVRKRKRRRSPKENKMKGKRNAIDVADKYNID